MARRQNPRRADLIAPRLEKTILNHWRSLIKPAAEKVEEEQKLSVYLWEQTTAQQNMALNSYFIQSIKTGQLDPMAFGQYQVQDAVYLYKAKTSIDVALTRATDTQLISIFAEKAVSYSGYYKDMFDDWHISNWDGIVLGEAALAYMNYEKYVASTKSEYYFLLSMIPCLKLWPWLGKKIEGSNHGVYTNWVNDNLNPSYEGYKEFDEIINDAYELGHITKEEALQVFSRCMDGEASFFASVQDPEKPKDN